MRCYRQMKHLLVKLGLCSLNQDPLNFKKNYEHIFRSIQICREQGCTIRVGGELEVSGYHCYDHFSEYDTMYHCWDVIRQIIKSGVTNGIVCDIGCPVLHKAALYNCRVILFNSKVVAIRPKMIMADGDNYFETRWFAPWKQINKIDNFFLPIIIQEQTKQTKVPIGIFIIDFKDTSLAYQICQQSWISRNPMIEAALDGAELFVNPSASFIERGKLQRKMQMMTEFTQRHGGAYAYVNMKGTSGNRTFMDGGCFFSENGKIKYLSKLHDLSDVQVTPVSASLNSIRTFRLSNKSFQKESNPVNKIPRVQIDFNVASCDEQYIADTPKHIQELLQMRNIYMSPHATWEPSIFLWEYLRKSTASGFYLPLSGGLDSCAVSLIIYNLCSIVHKAIVEEKSEQVLSDLRKVVRKPDFHPQSPKHICNEIFFTTYLGTQNSSEATKGRAKLIADTIGANHMAISFDGIYKQFVKLGKETTGLDMKFNKQGGSTRTDLALQNVQARTRMVLSYMYSNLMCEISNKPGFLLVLGASNLDQSLRGYFTKYDCSSADYNPIGSFSKRRLREILAWNQKLHGFGFIDQILNAVPTAELRPLKEGQAEQTDQQDMGFSYDELMRFGQLRKIQKLGPVSMFDRLLAQRDFKDPRLLAQKVKNFFKYYGINRHKMTTLTPSFHYDPESCDDNRFDMRPFLYETDWGLQFEQIDHMLESYIKLHPSSVKKQ